MKDPAAKLPSAYDVKLIHSGRVAVHQLPHDGETQSYAPGAIRIVYGLKPEGPNGELDGHFVDGQSVAQAWRPLRVVAGKYVEVSPHHKDSTIDKFHVDLLRRIAIEGDRESRIWAVETLLEIGV